MHESEFGAMQHAINEARDADEEFAFGGRTDGWFTVSQFSAAEKAMSAREDRIEKARQEQQG